MRENKRKTFLSSGRFYLVGLIAIGALVAAGFLIMPDYSSSSKVSAQRDNSQVRSEVTAVNRLPINESGEVATRDMIGIAFDLRSASDFSVFAEKGISDDGASRVRGDVGVGSKDAKITGITRGNVEGLVRDGDVEGYDRTQTQKDMSQAYNAMRQLPCVNIASEKLSDKVITPGVYCLPSASLAGQLTLDGNNDPDAIFVFRVAGSLNVRSNSRIDLTNGAAAYNTFFIVDEKATIGEGVSFKGSIVAQNSIALGNGSDVEGKVLSAKGEVAMTNNAVGGATGFIEICKQTTGDNAALLANRLFRFRIGNIIKEVPVGSCTAPFEVPVGPRVIEELLTGSTTSGGTYSGNFQLVNVVRSNINPPDPANDTTLDGFNLPLRTANITVRPGGFAQQTVFTFTNRYAITGIIEICKHPLDFDVSGFFNYIIEFVPQQGSNPAIPYQVFTVPVGGCSGPIAVTTPTSSPTVPREGVVRVIELSRFGYLFVGGNTSPAARLILVEVFNNPPALAPDNHLTNAAGAITGRILEGGINVQTTFNFFNRSAPGQVKVCKIAGPGITVNTPFTFDVTGTTTDNPAPPGPAVAPYTVTRTITVLAGPDNSSPTALGGFCTIVPGTFVVGTQVRVTETGPNYVAGTQGPTATFANTTPINVPAGQPAVTSGPADPSSIPVTVGAFGNKSIEVELTGITHTWNGDIDAVLVSPTGQDFLFASDIFEAPRPNTPVTVSFRDDAAGLAPSAGALAAGTYKPTNHPGIGSEPTATFNAPPTGGDSFASAFGTNGLAMNGNWNLVITDDAGGDSGQISGGWKITLRDLGFEIRVSRLRFAPGGQPATGSLAGKFIQTAVRRGFTEFEFANFVFRPGLLKVCKIAGPGVAVNTPFVFDITVDTVNGLFPDFARSITVPAGPAAQGGFCQFVDGPYAPAINGFGTYNLGSRLTVVERAQPGVTVTDIATNGASPVNNNGTRTSTFTMIPDVTEVSFTNAGGPNPNPGDRVRYDFDGDGKADQSVFRPSEGNWYVLRSGDNGFGAVQWGLATDKLASADFDNDGREDYAVMRGNMWYVLRSSDNGVMERNFGLAGDQPVPGDWDGDGAADLAVYREGGQSTFYFLGTKDNPLNNISNRSLGTTGDIPVPADYDGDGSIDAAVYRPSNGSWYILQSSNNQTRIVNFGISTDIPAPADVDGDRKADIIVYRDGIWYQFLSGNGTVRADQFGLAGDKPVPADYDGDGRADLAVYRNGGWHILRSTEGYWSIGFGTSSDSPIPTIR